METDKNTWRILQDALKEWEDAGKLTKEQAAQLRETINIKESDKQQIARYFFFTALFCTLLAFGAIFINEKLLEKIRAYFSWSNMIISLITAVLAVLWLWYAGKKRDRINPAAYETYMVLGGLSVLTALQYACKETGAGTTYLTFLLLSFATLITISVLLRSQSLWIGAILAFISWFGILSTVESKENLFFGMNYPVRFTVLASLILVASILQKSFKKLFFSRNITYTTGLLLFFTGLWAVSVFGNYNTLAEWHKVRQAHVLAYALIFGAASVASFYLGIRYKDDQARDIGLLFLLINLYTRYFEYFWDAMNKGIFFLIMAITFGFLGWWMERKKAVRKKMEHPA